VGHEPKGEIVGWCWRADGHHRGFLLKDGQYTFIEYPGAAYTLLEGVNAAGRFVGMVRWGDSNSGTLIGKMKKTQ
jgi:hypothetical protein